MTRTVSTNISDPIDANDSSSPPVSLNTNKMDHLRPKHVRKRKRRRSNRMPEVSSQCLFVLEIMAVGIFLSSSSSTTTFAGVHVMASTTDSGSFPARSPLTGPIGGNGDSGNGGAYNTEHNADASSRNANANRNSNSNSNSKSFLNFDAGGSSDDDGETDLESSSDFDEQWTLPLSYPRTTETRPNVVAPVPAATSASVSTNVSVPESASALPGMKESSSTKESASATTEDATSASTKEAMKESSTKEASSASTDSSTSETQEQQQDSSAKNENEQMQTQEQEPKTQAPQETAGSSYRQAVTKTEFSEESESSVALAKPQQAPDLPSQPLQTLQKLQQMLDETDYMTASRHATLSTQASNTAAAATAAAAVPSARTLSPEVSRPETLSPDTTTRPDPTNAGGSNSSTATTRKKSQATAAVGTTATDTPEKLWTSKDRSKYKKQQLRYRQAREVVVQEQQQQRKAAAAAAASPPLHHHYSSDDEMSDTDTDGLGYSLPNLPVYYSDAEAESDTDGESTTYNFSEQQQQQSRTTGSSSNAMPPALPATHPSAPQVLPPPPPDSGYNSANAYPPPPIYYPQYGQPPNQYMQQQQQQHQQQQQYPQHMYPPNAYPYQYPGYGPLPQQPQPPQHNYHSQQQQSQQYQQQYAQQYAAWAAAAGYLPQHYSGTAASPPPYPRAQQLQHQQYQQQQSSVIRRIPDASVPARPKNVANAVRFESTGSPTQAVDALSNPNHGLTFPMIPKSSINEEELELYAVEDSPTLVDTNTSRLSFLSVQKASLMLVTVALACYSAVSPRTLELTEYNLQFYENLRIVSLAAIAPAVNMLSVFNARHNDANAVFNTFFVAFSFGYIFALVMEIVVTTLVRLAVFCWFEPDIFRLLPNVPVPILPWVLRDNHYRPKRITLFAADFGTTCIACPIVEEYVKLKLLQWTTKLPRNFNWVTKVHSKTNKKRRTPEAILRGPGEQECVNANKYVCHMLAASLGLKLFDAARRILVYTKAHHPDKSFYAACRGLFPIQELCGTMTALALAKRDLLGVDMPLWKLLAPAVVIHGMANFRGMKPIFKWNSATPWSEMQLLPLHEADSFTFAQLLSKGFAKLMWVIIIGRVLGYCVKNYYMVNRQAVKRTTTYAGNHAAFSAELATAEMLKKK